MQKIKKKRESARDLYVIHGIGVSEIAELLGSSVATVKAWKTNDKWNDQAERHSTVPQTMFEVYANILKRTHLLSQRNDFDVDEMSKLVNQLEKVQPKQSHYNDFTRLTTEMTAYVQRNHPQLIEGFVLIIKEFAKTKFKHLYEE